MANGAEHYYEEGYLDWQIAKKIVIDEQFYLQPKS
jgi:hypothetical protein